MPRLAPRWPGAFLFMASRDRDIAVTAKMPDKDSNLVDQYPPDAKEWVRFSTASTRLAPNGKPSNLSEGQYKQVRTEAFKRWGGDWEAWGHRQFLEGEPVARLTGNEFQKTDNNLAKRVGVWFSEKFGGVVRNPQIGPVRVDESGADASISHGLGRDKACAFAAVPDVIKNGRVIDEQVNYKGRGYDTATIAAPMTIGTREYVAVVVVNRSQGDNSFYLHEVALTEKLRQSAFKTGASADKSVEPSGADDRAIRSILRRLFSVNRPSVLLDENGEPKVFYHGTESGVYVQPVRPAARNGQRWGDQLRCTKGGPGGVPRPPTGGVTPLKNSSLFFRFCEYYPILPNIT